MKGLNIIGRNSYFLWKFVLYAGIIKGVKSHPVGLLKAPVLGILALLTEVDARRSEQRQSKEGRVVCPCGMLRAL